MSVGGPVVEGGLFSGLVWKFVELQWDVCSSQHCLGCHGSKPTYNTQFMCRTIAWRSKPRPRQRDSVLGAVLVHACK